MPNKKKSRPAARKSGSAKKRARKEPRETASQQASAAAVLDAQKLKDLYSSMLKCRMLGDKMRELSSAQAAGGASEIAPGREAVLVGAVAHARPEDSVIAVQNQPLAEFIFSQGAQLNTLLASFKKAAVASFKKAAAGAPDPAGAASHGAHVALAHGMSRANEMKGSAKVSFVFCGDATAALASQLDTLGLVARNKLPLVCLIETGFSRFEQDQRSWSLSGQQDASSHFPRISVDGADVVAVFRVAQEAVRRARAGHGPSLIQCVMPEPDARGQSNDPLAFMERYLRQRKLWSNERRKKIAENFQRELETAF